MTNQLRTALLCIGLAALSCVYGCAADPQSDQLPGSGGAVPGSGGTGTGGRTGGSGGSGPPCPGEGGALSRLHVDGNLLKNTCGGTVVLRGSSLIDLGAIVAYEGVNGLKERIDKLIGAGLAGHVVRLPVYPRTNVNSTYPYYSPLPFPVGPAAPATATVTVRDVTAQDYVATVLRPAVDYAASKGLYAIIDYHQIDDTGGASGADATTFWTMVAPLFKDDANVLYEAFNEPIDLMAGSSPAARWQAYQPHAQAWVDAIRAGAPDTLIIVGAPSWSQNLGGAATTPVQGTNLAYTAHIYPGNWNATFKAEVEKCVAAHPVFVTEWGYATGTAGDKNLLAPSAAWGTDLQSYLDDKGASWTAWVADKDWGPPLYASNGVELTDFGTLVKGWLAANP
jgi:hypothetical protein